MSLEMSVFVVVIALILILYILGQRKAARSVSQRFSQREVIPEAEFCAVFHNATGLDGPLILELARHVSSELSIDPFLLRPTDRFDVELKPPQGWEFDSGPNILIAEVRNLAAAKGVDIDISTSSSVADYFKAMARVY